MDFLMGREAADVVVVGGSLAGLNAAYYAAKAGASVVLLERIPEIGCDVRCAEGVVEDILFDAQMPIIEGTTARRRELLSSANPVMDWMLDAGITHYMPYIATDLRQVRFRVHGRRPKTYDLKLWYKRGYILRRDLFEKALADRAIAAGAEIRTGVDVSHVNIAHATVEGIRYRTLIGADGVNSVVGRSAGLVGSLPAGDIGRAVQYTLTWTGNGGCPWDPHRIDIDWGVRGTSGYGWVFPRGPREANVGLGVAGEGRVKLQTALDEYCRELGLNGTTRRERFVGKAIPLARPPVHVVRRFGDGTAVMLAGDASRACLAHLGAGIGAALASGRAAGENWNASARYQEWYDRVWRPRAEKAWRWKERNWGGAGGVMRLMPLLLFLHRLFPRTMETRGFRSMRYTQLFGG